MKPISTKERVVLDSLLKSKLLPREPYNITEEHLVHYMHGYVKFLGKTSFDLRSTDYRYTRKLAGLTLLKHNVELGASVNEIKAGIVYVIENPIFPEHYKIGMTVDLPARLSTYQTYDPFRRFKVKHYEFVLNRRHTETIILNSFDISVEAGEWVKQDKCIDVFRQATFKYEKILAD